MRTPWGLAVAVVVLLGGCAATPSSSETPVGTSAPTGTSTTSAPRTGADGRPFVIEEIAELDEPWAMTFLPDGRALITGRGGELTLRATDGQLVDVSGVPDVVHAGQGGLGDVVAAPDFDRPTRSTSAGPRPVRVVQERRWVGRRCPRTAGQPVWRT